MEKLVLYLRELLAVNSFSTQREQQEYVLRIINYIALTILTLISFVFLVLGFLGYPVSVSLVDILLPYLVFLSGLFLSSRGKVKIVSYLMIFLMIFLGAWHTVLEGFNNINIYFYIVSLIFTFVLLDRNEILIAVIAFVPVAIHVVLTRETGANLGFIFRYLGFTIGLSLLLSVYQNIFDIFRTDRILVKEVEIIHRAGASVISSLDLRETISRILEQLTTIIPHDSASVMLLEDDGYLEIVGGRGWENPQDVLGIRFPIPGDNPNSIVIETGKPHILGNAADIFPEFKKEPHNHINSWLGIPLIRDGSIIGMMAIDSVQHDHFSEDHIRVLSSFADYVSIAIENALLYQVTNQSVQRRAVLHQASQNVIKASADLEEIYNAAFTAATQLMSCDAFAITLLRGEVYEGVFLIEAGKRYENQILPFGSGISGKVIGSGRSILVENVEVEKDFTLVQFGVNDVKSIIGVPLQMGTEILGAMTAQSFSVGTYSEEDLELLEMLGANAAIAIKNAQLLAKVAHLAQTDSLTGLLNRRAFEEILTTEISNANRYHYPVGLLMLDIDDFKQYNDVFGHSMGDERLKTIADLILQSVRVNDKVARIGGEEFTVILPHTNKAGAVKLAMRITKAVADEFAADGDPGGTVSVGVAIYPHAADSLKDLYIAADDAMFNAKRNGKNQVFAISSEVWQE